MSEPSTPEIKTFSIVNNGLETVLTALQGPDKKGVAAYIKQPDGTNILGKLFTATGPQHARAEQNIQISGKGWQYQIDTATTWLVDIDGTIGAPRNINEKLSPEAQVHIGPFPALRDMYLQKQRELILAYYNTKLAASGILEY